MKTSTKIILGALTAWPITAFLLYFAMFALASLENDKPYPHVFSGIVFLSYFVLAGSSALVSVGLTGYYIFHASKRGYLKGDGHGWAISLLFFGVIAQPVYWYMYIWREPVPLP
jgi:hypothetical protein